ncbi:MAG TPA: hypothetical protein VE010_20910 [Thermoanaerobaculia bacterium]|nr:hypothetical protein [Thermoanaerobaculia bacterium]
MRFAWLAAVLLLTASAALGEAFQKAAVIEPQTFSFSDGSRTCEVSIDGAGVCRRDGRRDWRFRLPTSDGEIEHLYAIAYGDDLLVAYELTDGEGGWAQLVRLTRGAKRLEWRFHVPGFNLTAPLLRERSVFVAALTFVARVDVDRGWSEWSLDHASSGDGYETSELSLDSTSVIVRSVDGTGGEAKTACFDIETGVCRSCGF